MVTKLNKFFIFIYERHLFSNNEISIYVQNTNMKLWNSKINFLLEIIFILIYDGNYIFISVG